MNATLIQNALTLQDFVYIVGKINDEHGWTFELDDLPEKIALMHSELSEALEEYREKKGALYYSETGKPEGIAVELVDCIIRIMHWFAVSNVNLEQVLKVKLEYNNNRSYRHGNKLV